jgi:ferredoxin-NADP reductase
VRVARIEPTARETNLYTFVSAGGAALPAAEPGAHVDLHLRPDLVRQYSLLRPSPAPEAYVLGIRKEAGGRGGSRYIHECLRVGDEIEIGAPRNNFPLVETAGHSLLIAGGIGITPIRAMAARLAELGRSWHLHAANRSRADAPLLAELAESENVSLHFDDEAGGFLDIAAIVASAPPNSHVYCCGPAPMLAAFRAATAGLPADRVHDEAFGLVHDAAGEKPIRVRLARSAREILIPASASILETLRDQGMDLLSSCEAGVCGMCETRVLAGEIDHRDHVLGPDEQAENSRMMICCSRARSDTLVLDI